MEINFTRHQLVSLAAALVGATQKGPRRMRRRLDINTTPIKPKTERCCSRRQQFRHYCGSSGRRNNRQVSCKVNFHVTQSALQNSMCLLGIFFLISFSLDPTLCGILVCGTLQLMFIEFQLLFNRIFRKSFANSKQLLTNLYESVRTCIVRTCIYKK